MILGLVGFFCGLGVVLGPLAIVYANMSYKAVERGEANNKGNATAGLVFGILACVAFVVILLVELGNL